MTGQQQKKIPPKNFWFVLDYCSLEALDTNVWMVLASMISWGRSFVNKSLLIII